MNDLEIIGLNDQETIVNWRYKGIDGDSAMLEGKVQDAYPIDGQIRFDIGLMLRIKKEINKWLKERK